MSESKYYKEQCPHFKEILDLALKYKITIDPDDPYVHHHWVCGICKHHDDVTAVIEDINAEREGRRSEWR